MLWIISPDLDLIDATLFFCDPRATMTFLYLVFVLHLSSPPWHQKQSLSLYLLIRLLDSLRILSLSDVAWDGSLLFTARAAFLSSSLGKRSSEYTFTQSSLADDLSPYFLPYKARILVSIWCIYLSTCIEVIKLQPQIMSFKRTPHVDCT